MTLRAGIPDLPASPSFLGFTVHTLVILGTPILAYSPTLLNATLGGLGASAAVPAEAE